MAYSTGKLAKYNVLAGSPKLASFLPKTRRFNEQNFLALLDQYGKAIVKPTFGSGGVGVIQVSSQGNETYEVHYGKTKKTISGRHLTYAFVQGITNQKHHIVQQKIPLAMVNGRPFDVRVMVQRNKNSVWLVTGKLAKIAGAGYIVTNYILSKGRVIPLSSAISQSNIHGKSETYIQSQIDRIALLAVKRLQMHYRINTIGLDIGLDAKGNVWIIEANFSPLKSLFLHLKDKSIYWRILAMSREK